MIRSQTCGLHHNQAEVTMTHTTEQDGNAVQETAPATDSRAQPKVTKAFLVAASYHHAMAKDYMVEAARLELAHRTHGDQESLELSKVAMAHANSHSNSAGDMMRMSIGEKPEHIDDAFDEFEKTRARILA